MNGLNKFWLVWHHEGHPPTRKHSSKVSAQQEASRLAGCNPGKVFVVMSSVDAFGSITSPVVQVPIIKAEYDDGIPF